MALTIAPLEIRDAVRGMFDRVAEDPTAKYRFEVGRSLARRVGYPEEVLDSVPPASAEAFTGLAYLHPFLALEPGEHVLDLGCGSGLDAVIAGRAVGPGGSVTGLDLAEAMIARARALAAALDLAHVRFEPGEAEAMPFGAASFDAAMANGVFNLCPDKRAPAAELLRVLRPGGRAVVAEITFTEPLDVREMRSVDDWFR